jgi:hypothetical protein
MAGWEGVSPVFQFFHFPVPQIDGQSFQRARSLIAFFDLGKLFKFVCYQVLVTAPHFYLNIISTGLTVANSLSAWELSIECLGSIPPISIKVWVHLQIYSSFLAPIQKNTKKHRSPFTFKDRYHQDPEHCFYIEKITAAKASLAEWGFGPTYLISKLFWAKICAS